MGGGGGWGIMTAVMRFGEVHNEAGKGDNLQLNAGNDPRRGERESLVLRFNNYVGFFFLLLFITGGRREGVGRGYQFANIFA